MNFKFFLIFTVLAIFISSFSCSNKPNRSRKPVVQINIESAGKKIKFGDDLTIKINVKIKDGELAETSIYIDSVLITSDKKAEFNYSLNKFEQLGKHTVKAVSVKTDGVEGTYYKTFEVLSDIVPENYGYELVQTYPHKITSYTEGLEFYDGFLYESTGENGKSMLMKNDLKTGKTIQSVKLADSYFGEGMTIFNHRIYQLTYKTKIGLVYNLQNMALVDSFRFESAEGWGLTHDEQYLIMSDGSNKLTYLDPETYKTVKKLQVYDDENATIYLNELEYSDGYIYANLWTTNLIAKIDAKTGKVVSKINLDGILILSNDDHTVDVLNGIAIDPLTKRIFVTGKFYSKIFEIKPVKKG